MYFIHLLSTVNSAYTDCTISVKFKVYMLSESCLEKIILCRQAEIMCRLIFHQDEFFGLSVARSLRSQSLCRFATNVFITYGNKQGSRGAAREARGLLGLRIWPNSWLYKWKFQVAFRSNVVIKVSIRGIISMNSQSGV